MYCVKYEQKTYPSDVVLDALIIFQLRIVSLLRERFETGLQFNNDISSDLRLYHNREYHKRQSRKTIKWNIIHRIGIKE